MRLTTCAMMFKKVRLPHWQAHEWIEYDEDFINFVNQNGKPVYLTLDEQKSCEWYGAFEHWGAFDDIE